MKPATIKVKTLVKVGLGAAALNFAMDLGKAVMFKAFKASSPEEANKMMEVMNEVDEIKGASRYQKIRIKIVRGLCKALTEE